MTNSDSVVLLFSEIFNDLLRERVYVVKNWWIFLLNIGICFFVEYYLNFTNPNLLNARKIKSSCCKIPLSFFKKGHLSWHKTVDLYKTRCDES